MKLTPYMTSSCLAMLMSVGNLMADDSQSPSDLDPLPERFSENGRASEPWIQGAHGSERRGAENMKEFVTYGPSAKESTPKLNELIKQFRTECAKDPFPSSLNPIRNEPVVAAIHTIQTASTQPNCSAFFPPPRNCPTTEFPYSPGMNQKTEFPYPPG